MHRTKRVRRFLKTPKGLLTIVFGILVAIAAPHEGLRVVAPGLVGAVLAAGLIDLVVLRIRHLHRHSHPRTADPHNVIPHVKTSVATPRHQAYTTPITDSGHAGAGDRETDCAPACPNGEPTMPSLFFTCPNTRQQADTGIMTDAESLRDTWSMTLNVNCPHCGDVHAVSVRETYIDDAIRNVSEIARSV